MPSALLGYKPGHFIKSAWSNLRHCFCWVTEVYWGGRSKDAFVLEQKSTCISVLRFFSSKMGKNVVPLPLEYFSFLFGFWTTLQSSKLLLNEKPCDGARFWKWRPVAFLGCRAEDVRSYSTKEQKMSLSVRTRKNLSFIRNLLQAEIRLSSVPGPFSWLLILCRGKKIWSDRWRAGFIREMYLKLICSALWKTVRKQLHDAAITVLALHPYRRKNQTLFSSWNAVL